MNLFLHYHANRLLAVICRKQAIFTVIQINLQCIYDILLIITDQYVIHGAPLLNPLWVDCYAIILAKIVLTINSYNL